MADFIAKSGFRDPYQAKHPVFFGGLLAKGPKKALQKGRWNRLEHRHGLNVNGFCGVHLDVDVSAGFANKMGSA